MKKRTYKAKPFNRVDLEALGPEVDEQRITAGVDIAKEKVFVALLTEDKRKLVTVTFSQPGDIHAFVAWLSALPAKQLDIVLEPTGTYGDAFRERAAAAGLQTFQVGTKRVHDAAEVFDGVPSLHDAKAAELIALLHLDGASKPWKARTEAERSMSAAISTMEMYDDAYRRNVGRLEARLARYWPELGTYLELGSATMLNLLETYRGPAAVAADADEAREMLRRVGPLSSTKIEAIIESSAATVGVEMVDEEGVALAALATEVNRHRRALLAAQRHVAELGKRSKAVQRIAPVIGCVSAAVVVSRAGDLSRYESAASLFKALGMNLKVHSSGTAKTGQLRITKRGHGIVRKYLFLAVLRKLRSDEVFRAWYARKVARDGGKAKLKAIVALMRKLVAGLWHISVHDEEFDSAKLFDVRRLDLVLEDNDAKEAA